MREILKLAKQELIERWATAFDEMEKFGIAQEQTVSVKFADIFSYNLSGYKNGRIKPGSKLFNVPPANNYNYGKYGFDDDGFLTTAEIYSRGKLSNFGFFTKTKDLIEYVEFSAERNVPSSIQRIVFDNGKKILLQSVFANGRSGFHFRTAGNLIEQVAAAFNDSYSAGCSIEEYNYDENRITRAYGLSILPGIGEELYENVYSYQGNRLMEIKTYRENGSTAIAYTAPSGRSLTAISNELAEMFADYLVSVLKKRQFDSPVFSVELSYQYCSMYHPNPVVLTQLQKQQAIAEKDREFFSKGEFIYATDDIPAELTRLTQEFYQLMQSTDNWEAGRKMLKRTAILMTSTKLKGEIPVADDFITFPIEWELEWEDFGKILLQCGMPKSNIKEWKSYGWI